MMERPHPGLMRTRARAEWNRLREVMVHPPGFEVFFALLAPNVHLYERFFDRCEARREHEALCRLLGTGYGVRVRVLEQELLAAACSHRGLRDALVRLADRRLERSCEGDVCSLPGKFRDELANPVSLRDRDPRHLLDIVTMNPSLRIGPARVDVTLGRPLHNLYFMRDQQVTTDRGIISGRMATAERQDEVDLCRLGLRAAGAGPAGAITRGTLEGGDFIPCRDFALVGRGVRTSREGIDELFSIGLGFDEVAVVNQPVHPLVSGHDPMVCMHLDTYFNIAGDGVAVGCPPLLDAAGVTVWHREGDGYAPAGSETTLSAYIRSKGYALIAITTLEQLCYASNFLCVRDHVCLSPDTARIAPVVLRRLREKERAEPGKYARLITHAAREYRELSREADFFPAKPEVHAHGLEMEPVKLTSATGGYGGAHCMTCVIAR
jgi:arginine deiminase